MIQESWGKGVYSILFSFLFFFTLFVYNLVTSMMELLDLLVFLQVECEKYMFLDKHQIIFGIKMQDQVFSNSNREMGFGKRDQLNL
jgi:hypothetical protein